MSGMEPAVASAMMAEIMGPAAAASAMGGAGAAGLGAAGAGLGAGAAGAGLGAGTAGAGGLLAPVTEAMGPAVQGAGAAGVATPLNIYGSSVAPVGWAKAPIEGVPMWKQLGGALSHGAKAYGLANQLTPQPVQPRLPQAPQVVAKQGGQKVPSPWEIRMWQLAQRRKQGGGMA